MPPANPAAYSLQLVFPYMEELRVIGKQGGLNGLSTAQVTKYLLSASLCNEYQNIRHAPCLSEAHNVTRDATNWTNSKRQDMICDYRTMRPISTCGL